MESAAPAGAAPAAPASGRSMRRLIMTHMVFENFKSYAGVRQLGPLHKNFTAVVGPNGSGKSNVIDGILFVFGFKARKLRLNKVSELIHKSAEHPDCEFAKVSIHFQEVDDDGQRQSDTFALVPGTELVISRTAFRSNQSKYEINSRSSSFSEVTDLLKARGFDLNNNRFLILQGEVEQIAQMKPRGETPQETGMLEFFEDIIGSAQFVQPIAEAQEKVEELNEARVEKQRRFKLAQRQREAVRADKERAETFLHTRKSVLRSKSHLFQLYAHDAREAKADLHSRAAAARERLAEQEQRGSEERAEAERLEGCLEEKRTENDGLRAEAERAKGEWAKYERLDVKWKEDMKHLKDSFRSLETAHKKEQKARGKQQGRVEDLRARAPEAAAEVERLERVSTAERETYERMLGDVRGEAADMSGQLAQAQREVEPLRTARNEADAELRNATAEREAETARADRAHAAMEAALEEQRAAQRVLEEHPARLEAAKADLRAAKAEKKTTAAALTQARQEASDGAAGARKAADALESARAAAQQQQQGPRSRAARSLMAAAAPGGPLAGCGLLGRLGDLGWLPAEYDVAATTASGVLDYLVVETSEGGQRCVEYLRAHDLGRAKFVMLDRVQYLREAMERPMRLPSGAVRLYDLIRPADDRLRPAFFFAVRNTLVTEDMDAATRIAYQKGKCVWRVVTLGGELIEMSGTMTGGGNTVRRGGICTREATVRTPGAFEDMAGAGTASGASAGDASAAAHVARLEQAAEEATAQLGACRQKVADLEVRLEELESRVAELEATVPDLEATLAGAQEEVNAAAARVAQHRAACELTDEEAAAVAKVDKRIAKLQKKADEAREAARGAEESVSALEEQVQNVGGEPLKLQRERMEDAQKRLDAQRKEATRCRVSLKSAEKAAAKAEEAVAELEAEMAALTEKRDALKAEREPLEAEASAVLEACEQAQAVLAERVAEMKALKKEYEAVKRRADKVDRERAKMANDAKRFDEEAKGKDSEVATQLGRVEVLRKQYMDEFGDEEEEEEEKEAEGEGAEEGEARAPARRQPLPLLEEGELAALDARDLERKITVLEARRDKLSGSVNHAAIAEYHKRDKECGEREAELTAATEARDAARAEYERLRKCRLDMFLEGFHHISAAVKSMYRMITLGGDAELEQVDSCDPFEGVNFSVRPPRKAWRNIANLSGGEKTLSSLALVFALHQYRPSPLYMMDEIDAALDFKNVSIIANYIKERTHDAQFVIISLRNDMFELADRLVGIYKTHNATKSVTINPHKVPLPVAQAAAGEGEGAFATAKRALSSGASEPLGDRTNVEA